MAQGPHSADLTATADPKADRRQRIADERKRRNPWVATVLRLIGGIAFLFGALGFVLATVSPQKGGMTPTDWGSVFLFGLVLLAMGEALSILASIEHRLYQCPPT